MDIADWCIDPLIRFVLSQVELLSIDPLTKNFLAPLIVAQGHSGAAIKLQCHFKVRHVEQSNSALNQLFDDNVQKAMSMGMLIQAPVEQTPELLRDVGPRCSQHRGWHSSTVVQGL